MNIQDAALITGYERTPRLTHDEQEHRLDVLRSFEAAVDDDLRSLATDAASVVREYRWKEGDPRPAVASMLRQLADAFENWEY